MIRTAVAIGRKELHQVARDRRTLLILLFVPAFFLLLYGYALNFDIRNIRLAVEDHDRSIRSRSLVEAFVQSGYFVHVDDSASTIEASQLVDRNHVRVVLVVPPGFGRDVDAGRTGRVQVLVDGDNANTASTVLAYVQQLVAEVGTDWRAPLAVAPGGIAIEPRVWYNPQLRSALFLVPGLIAYIAMISAVISTALAIVREKERGTMEQVRMAPVHPLAFVIGKTLPYTAISFSSSMVIVLVAMALFDLPMRGSWLVLSGAIALFLVGAQAQGVLISTIAQTQQVAFQVALLSSFLPTLILSGFIFPLASMPLPIQVVSHIVPARYFIVALRAIVLKGVGPVAFWQDLAALGLFAAVALTLASVRLSREWA